MGGLAVRPAPDGAFEEIKELFDPAGLMNPGKIVRATRMDDKLPVPLQAGLPAEQPCRRRSTGRPGTCRSTRDGAGTAPGTGGDPAGGFAKAVDMCNNNGHCRKFDAGTMCPSYRVTKDEQHLTRGRANTLRLALSGQLGEDGFTSEAMRETLDLCVSCKGCKRDCPTGIDMARMKTEFLYHYQKKHGLSLQGQADRQPAALGAVGGAPALAGQPARPPAGGGRLSEKLFGLSASARCRAGAATPSWPACPGAHPAPEQADVVLFADTFNNYFESENAAAALQVLQAAGYKVHVARPAS
jgi:Fe-S oxidoreductase